MESQGLIFKNLLKQLGRPGALLSEAISTAYSTAPGPSQQVSVTPVSHISCLSL